MTTAEAKDILGITVCRVWQLIHTGRLRAVKAGHRWDIDPRSVRDYQRTRGRGRPPGAGRVYGGQDIEARQANARALRDRGISVADIAAHQQVSIQTTYRDLRRSQA